MDTKIKALILTFIMMAYLGSFNGQLALFTGSQNKPAETYPLRTEMLPISDQRALEKGIPIRDSLQLAQLLEDFLS